LRSIQSKQEEKQKGEGYLPYSPAVKIFMEIKRTSKTAKEAARWTDQKNGEDERGGALRQVRGRVKTVVSKTNKPPILLESRHILQLLTYKLAVN
jgi:hypothetical protein